MGYLCDTERKTSKMLLQVFHLLVTEGNNTYAVSTVVWAKG